MTATAYVTLGIVALIVLCVAVAGFLWLLQVVLNAHDGVAIASQGDGAEPGPSKPGK